MYDIEEKQNEDKMGVTLMPVLHHVPELYSVNKSFNLNGNFQEPSPHKRRGLVVFFPLCK